MNFSYQNIVFKRGEDGKGVAVKGEITNFSGRPFNSVVFRATIFAKMVPIGNVAITINGFYNGQTRTFERQFEDLEYNQLNVLNLRCEIFAESAY